MLSGFVCAVCAVISVFNQTFSWSTPVLTFFGGFVFGFGLRYFYNERTAMWRAIRGLNPTALSIVRDAYENCYATCADDSRFGYIEPLRRAGIVCGSGEDGTFVDRDRVVLTVEAMGAIKAHERKFDEL